MSWFDLSFILPEIFILSMAGVLLMVEAFGGKNRTFYAYIFTLIGLVCAAVLIIGTFPLSTEKTTLMEDAIFYDLFGWLNKLFIVAVSFLVMLYSRPYLNRLGIETGEYYIISLFAILGMLVMSMGNSMLVIYMGLELMSLSMYAMIALNKKSGTAVEAAMKYFVLGAIASGMLLYGIAVLYGLTSSLELDAVGAKIADSPNRMMVMFGLSLIIIGLAFKLGAAPFHMWLPDVYHGSPTAVTMFVGAAPKIAVFVIIIRFLSDGLQSQLADWRDILTVLAVLSMVVGNLIAIAQTNIKRMLAYSGISHAGFFLLGVLAGNGDGFGAAMFYMVVYAFTAAGTFGIIIIAGGKGFEAEELSDYKGLAHTRPWLAFLMAIMMFSMAGVPPAAGFYAKLSVIKAVLAIDMVWLAVVAVFMAIIGVFYYLRVVVYMYFHEPDKITPPTQSRVALEVESMVSINALAMLVLGLFPAYLMGVCIKAFGG